MTQISDLTETSDLSSSARATNEVETDPSINEEAPEVDEVVFLDEPEANDLGLKQPHSKKKKSWVWEHFQKTAKKGGNKIWLDITIGKIGSGMKSCKDK